MPSSGRIRQSLSPLRQALELKVIRCEEFITTQPTTYTTQLLPEITTILNTTEELSLGLQLSRKKVEDKDEAWGRIIDAIEDAEAAVEELQLHKIWAIDETNGYLKLVARSEDLEVKLQVMKSRLSERIHDIKSGERRIQATEQANQANGQPSSPQRTDNVAKLPKITLPRFGGNALDWNSFWSIFSATIDSRTNISDIEKLTYLLAQLDSTAKASVAGLPMVPTSYATTIQLLRDRFERSNSDMKSALYSELRRVSRAGNTFTNKRAIYDNCEQIFRQLATVGEDVSKNEALTFELMSKFPENMIQDLYHYHKISSDTQLGDLRHTINQYLRNEERMVQNLNDFRTMKIPTDGGARRDPSFRSEGHGCDRTTLSAETVTSAFLSTAPRTEYGARKIPCFFCNGEHFNSACSKYATSSLRRKRLAETGRCGNCTRDKHPGSTCQLRRNCFYCSEAPASPVCKKQFPDHTTESKSTSDTAKATSGLGSSKDVTLINRNSSKRRSETVLMTAKCRIINAQTNRSAEARVILDSASHRDYITEKLAQKLTLPVVERETVGVKVFGTEKQIDLDSSVVSFGIQLRDGSIYAAKANTTPLISDASVLPTGITANDKRILHELGSELADTLDDPVGTIDVLLGAGHFWDIVCDSPMTTESSLKLIPSKIGILLSGRVQCQIAGDVANSTLFCITANEYDHQTELEVISHAGKLHNNQVVDFWHLESIGIHDDPHRTDDEAAMQIFNETVCFDQQKKRYQVQWPWIPDTQHKLPSNLELAFGRFRSLAKRLRAEPELLPQYRKTLQNQVDRGIIEKVPNEECINPKHPTHYLPHHPVVTRNVNEAKLRIVYDASARVKKEAYSLNDCIYRGPVILPSLVAILIRMRLEPTVMLADVEKAFLQISLHPRDRDVTRFFWFEDDTINVSATRRNLTAYRFCRVPFGIIASPFLLGAVIQHHLMAINTILSKQAARDMYVDNLITATLSEESGYDLYQQMKKIFNDVGMNLRAWCSNSKVVMDKIPDEDKVTGSDVKILGMRWRYNTTDTIRVTHRNWKQHASCATKREIMQALASVYDPLGFYQPVILPAKLLLQQLWTNKFTWDEPIPSEFCNRWRQVHDDIELCLKHEVPRYIHGYTVHANTTIVGFCDASKDAYAASFYVRVNTDEGWQTHLIFSKSRVTPTGKPITLPRLELLGMFICVKGIEFLWSALLWNVHATILCDSQVVLNWLRSSKTLERFVRNRIEYIRKLGNVEFCHVRVEDNPADKGTRAVSGEKLVVDDLWWHGPSWIKHDRTEWPIDVNDAFTDSDLADIQNCNSTALLHTLLVGESQRESEVKGIHQLLDVNRFSVLRRLLRITSWVFEAIRCIVWRKLSVATRTKFPQLRKLYDIDDDKPLRINSSDLQHARRTWIRHAQLHAFPEVLEAIKGRKRNSMVNQLGLQLDCDGMIRSCSRFENADIAEPTRFPILLPKKHPLTKLIRTSVHQANLHVGIEHTLAEIRKKFWILHGRQAVRTVITKCAICRKNRGQPFTLPKMPPWPIERMVRSSPFTYIGLDYLGPIHVKLSDAPKKHWVCIFTCLATRAIHLEWVSDCSGIEFLNSLKRFMARRGVPNMILCDNATQFRLVQSISDQIWYQPETDETLMSFCADKGVQWKFIVPLAPWQGGIYERLIASVKAVLRIGIGRKLLPLSEFVTLLTETEAIVNSRPISYVASDANSQGRIVRPIDFLVDLPICDPAPKIERELQTRTATGDRILQYLERRRKYMDALWKRWQTDYLLSLRDRGRNIHRGSMIGVTRPLIVGEVVLVHDQTPRGTWQLARVAALIPSQDGVVRAAEIVQPNRRKLRRSIRHLIPLEIRSSGDQDEAKYPLQQDDTQFQGFDAAEIDEAQLRLQLFQEHDSVDNDDREITMLISDLSQQIQSNVSLDVDREAARLN